MNTIQFNFNKIQNEQIFYETARRKLNLPDYFGDNLDALWDSLTGDIPLPISIRFINLVPKQVEQFQSIFSVFEDAATELGNDFQFSYFLKEMNDENG